MDYLQYLTEFVVMAVNKARSFKPCYKWITFNTPEESLRIAQYVVLNLVINGLPSIRIKRIKRKFTNEKF